MVHQGLQIVLCALPVIVCDLVERDRGLIIDWLSVIGWVSWCDAWLHNSNYT